MIFDRHSEYRNKYERNFKARGYYAEMVGQVNEDTKMKYIKDEFHMKELYDMDISDCTISQIMNRILPVVREWQERPLKEVYAAVFMDAINYHIRSEGCIVKSAVYIALDIDMNGRKDVLTYTSVKTKTPSSGCLS